MEYNSRVTNNCILPYTIYFSIKICFIDIFCSLPVFCNGGKFLGGGKICPSSTLTARQTAVQVFFQAQAVRLSPTIACFRLLQVVKPQADGGQYSSILRQGRCRQLPAEPPKTSLMRELYSNKRKNTPPNFTMCYIQ